MRTLQHVFRYKGKNIKFSVTVYPAGDEAEIIKIHGKTGDVEILSYRPYFLKKYNYNDIEYHLITCPKDFDLSEWKSLANQVLRHLSLLGK